MTSLAAEDPQNQLAQAMRQVVDRALEVTGAGSVKALATSIGVSRQHVHSGLKGESFGLKIALRLAEAAGLEQEARYELVWSLMRRLSANDKCAKHFVRMLDTMKPLVGGETWDNLRRYAIESYIAEEA